jgi:hypothetical protein
VHRARSGRLVVASRRTTPKKRTDKVCLAYVHGLEVAHSWHQSVMALVSWDISHAQHVIGGGWLATKYGTGGIVQARNDTVTSFLNNTDSDWLLWIDTDMGFAPDSVDKLIAAADPKTSPVVGGLCFMQREVGPDGTGGMIVQPLPTLFEWTTVGEAHGFGVIRDYPRDTVMEVAATGSAFILIHRSALEQVEAKYGKSWYSPVYNDSAGMWISEDLSLCTRLAAIDIPVHVHTGVKTTHLKQLWLDERIYDRLDVVGN